ncbi:MAG: hypothetical protein K5787_08560 [Lentisphaeria bacterium]|nr:hypothetical protein [Victivallales bacterium]MCR4573804.1 hypothetical protein [Lentisphaeria bacterium]
MATESIFHNFTIERPEEIKLFAEALEKAANTRSKKPHCKSTLVTDPVKIRDFFAKKEKGEHKQI